MSVTVRSRKAERSEIPDSAYKLGAKGEALGWTANFTYARGEAPGRSVKVIDSLCVRFSRTVRLAPKRTALGVVVAVYEDGKFRCGLTPQHRLNMRELVAVLEDPASLLTAAI